MKNLLLDLELRLLILRHGRQSVLHALAELGEQTTEEFERHLSAAEQHRNVSHRRMSAEDIASDEGREHPDIAQHLRALAVAFQSRTFLPHLRDVQRFLDRAGAKQGRLKSRDSAAKTLFHVLAKLPREELSRLASAGDLAGESDYSLLAKAIMGPEPPKPQDSSDPVNEGGGT